MAICNVRVNTCCCGFFTLRTGTLFILWYLTITFIMHVMLRLRGWASQSQPFFENSIIIDSCQLCRMMICVLLSVAGIFAVKFEVPKLLLGIYYFFICDIVYGFASITTGLIQFAQTKSSSHIAESLLLPMLLFNLHIYCTVVIGSYYDYSRKMLLEKYRSGVMKREEDM